MEMKTCCFFGHREIDESDELKLRLYETVERLITVEGVDTFLFGSQSRFNELSYEVVTEIKEKFTNIKRVYVRAEFPVINENYKKYLLERYEETFFPEKIKGAGRSVYVERNYEMIDKSSFCVVYYDKNYLPTNRKSGTKIALDYAVKKKKDVINLKICEA